MSVVLKNALKRFGNLAAVDGVTADIADGEFFVVLGASGCGKSTLLRLIAGLERLDGGDIAINGETVSSASGHVPPEDRQVGFVFQSYALWPHMTVLDNVAFPAEAKGAARAEARREAERHLETVSLSALAHRKPAELSGGQRQRVALARCLAGGARTVLMDEPLANLDPHLRGRMEDELARFHRGAGTTTIYITHDQREAMTLADRIAVMKDGRFLQIAAPEVIHDRPATADVARFVGRAAVLDATVRDGHEGTVAACGPLTIPVPGARGSDAQIVVRPGQVEIGQGDLQGNIHSAHFRGEAWEGTVAVDGLADPLPFRSSTRISAGETVPLTVKTAWVLPEPGGSAAT